jgi:hypothetical protein
LGTFRVLKQGGRHLYACTSPVGCEPQFVTRLFFACSLMSASLLSDPAATASAAPLASPFPLHLSAAPDGKVHTIRTNLYRCQADSRGCYSTVTLVAHLNSTKPPSAFPSGANAAPHLTCPGYVDTYNYFDAYSFIGLHLYHIELDTEEYIDPCNYVVKNDWRSPTCQTSWGWSCDNGSSNGSYYDSRNGVEVDWYNQSTSLFPEQDQTYLSTHVDPSGNVFACPSSSTAGNGSFNCGTH